MSPLQNLEALDARIAELQQGQPQLQESIAPDRQRQDFFAQLADFWSAPVEAGESRLEQLGQLRRAQLLAELELRLADHTLDADAAALLRTCLSLPLAWQRQNPPLAQVLRPVFSTLSPSRRCHLPGALVIVTATPGQAVAPGDSTGNALLCTFSHGIEAFADLNQLHIELCERLDDPLQSQPLLALLAHPEERLLVQQADRLRYEWYADDPFAYQAQCLIDLQRLRLTEVWRSQGKYATGQLHAHLDRAMDLTPLIGSEQPLSTRYALLLEKHLPPWLRKTSAQGLAHIMQTMQDLAGAIALASGPGILSFEAFTQRHNLIEWVRERLSEKLRNGFGITTPAHAIQVSVTLARRKGALVNPLHPSSYIPVASRPQVGDTVELVTITYRLDELALLNIEWFDINYWLTARVHGDETLHLEGLTPEKLKQMVRDLDAGTSYQRFLKKHLLHSPTANWRMEAHGRINRARMMAEAVKARHAGHFLADSREWGYRWARTIIRYPNSNWRATVDEHRISVRQLLIKGETLQGVLLLNAEVKAVTTIVVYAPDAPDRRPWREYRNARELLRELRGNVQIREYVRDRLPLSKPGKVEKLLLSGKLAPHLQRLVVDENLFEAQYKAEVRALMAQVDASTRSNAELLGRFSVNALRLLLDLVSLVLPFPASIALAFGRAAISIWEGFEALEEGDRYGALHHAFATFSHLLDGFHGSLEGLEPTPAGLKGFSGAPLLRRVLRGMPAPRPLPLPATQAVAQEVSKLRYLIDGIYKEGIYEKTGSNPGLSQYYIKDQQGRVYHVNFDGHRWRATDPRQPDAFIKLPLKRLLNGNWVVDSPVLWHDGLPDLQALLESCRLAPQREGSELALEPGLFEADGQLYLQLQGHQLPVRRHLLTDHYHLQVPASALGAVHAWAVLRRTDQQWRIRVRQPGRSSDWLALPADYSASLGSNLSSR
ncbi:dermonecrotic toxin domain-containing protein [Pseudomonas putida]|uniref:Dermonecrotic toxin N-terminal domain-containing protein n=1 Tax=Pseudomonas putida TaxID=303 RepID=A0A6I6XBT9_PSEPU|nr:DUF6543 domain-containing protein [Pseudomonas putida]QHG62925.1 hypothetical protein C2H86_00195 [Pseudomonas putida]